MACMRAVEVFGELWAWLGWGLFAFWFLVPITMGMSDQLVTTWVIATLLLLLWWLIDAVSQMVALWKVLVAVVMLGIGLLPRGGLLTIACWALYWTQVRE